MLTSEHFYFYTTAAFILGALTSLISGYIGMYIATRANVRVTYMAASSRKDEIALKNAFDVAFRGGAVMGFILVSLALSILLTIILIYQAIYKPSILDPERNFLHFSKWLLVMD